MAMKHLLHHIGRAIDRFALSLCWLVFGCVLGATLQCQTAQTPDCPPESIPSHPRALIGAASPSSSTTDPEEP